MQADDAANYYVNISYILLPGSDYVADPRPPPPPRRVPISLVMALPSPRSLLFNMHAGMLYKADGDACIPPPNNLVWSTPPSERQWASLS